MSISQPISTLTINNKEVALAKSPYIGSDGFWYVFDEGNQAYKRSTSKAAITGAPGPQGKGIKSDVPVEFISDTESEDYGKLRFTLYDPVNPAKTISVMTNNSVKGEQGYQGTSITNIEEITEGEHSGELKITTTNPASGSAKDYYYTGRIAAGFGTLTATVDNNVGTPSVSVSASGSDMAKNFSFEFHNLKGVQGYQGNMITDIDVSNNHIVFTLNDPATGSSSTITTSGEVAPVTVNGVSPSDGNITITGEDISIDDSTSAPTIAEKIENIENNYVSSNTYANYERAGIIQIGNGIYLSDNTISVRQQDVITVDRGLSTTSENPVQNKVITSAIDSVREDMSELVTGVSMVNQKTGIVSLYADDIQIDSSSIVTLKDLIHFDSRNPVISDEDKKYSNSLWVNKTTGDVFYYTELNIWGTVYPSWSLLSISPSIYETTATDVSIRTGAWKTVAELTLSAGKWLLIGNPRWSNGSPNSGTRQMCFSTTSNSNTAYGKNVVVLSGSDTNYIGQSSSYIITLSSFATVYLNVYQTQGSTLTCSAEFQAERVG